MLEIGARKGSTPHLFFTGIVAPLHYVFEGSTVPSHSTFTPPMVPPHSLFTGGAVLKL